MLDSCIICDEGRHCGDSISKLHTQVKLEMFQQPNLERFFQSLGRYIDSIPLGGDGASRVWEVRLNQQFQQALNTGIGTCECCSKLVESFCDLYHQMKSIQLLLNWKVETLANLMKNEQGTASTGNKNVLHWTRSLETDDDDYHNLVLLDFKKDLIKKCERKIRKTFPRVFIEGLITPKGNSASNEETNPSPINMQDSISCENLTYNDDNDDHLDQIYESRKSKGKIPEVAESSPSSPPKITKQIPPASFNPETGKNKCYSCQKEFKQVADYRIHYESVHLKIRYKCNICGKAFHLISSYQRHLRGVHMGPRIQCNKCNKPFSDKRNLARHQRLTCGKERKKKKTSHVLDKYEAKDTNQRKSGENSGNWNKNLDGVEFHSENTVKEMKLKPQVSDTELDDIHSDADMKPESPATSIEDLGTQKEIPPSCGNLETGKNKCGACDKEFKKVADYRIHYRSVHLKIRYECAICSKTFYRISTYQRHQKGVHNGPRIQCDQCEKPFSDKHNLAYHQRYRCEKIVSLQDRTQVPMADKFKCELCWKDFFSRDSYKAHHRNVHMGARFSCPVCSESFTRRYAVKVHQHRKHPDLFKGTPPKKMTTSTPHICEICGKSFRERAQLNTHFKTVHLKLKEHVCDQCGSRFGRSENLKEHIKIVHLKVREHTCDRCGKGFGRKEELRVHFNAVHLKLREHICKTCGKGFANPRNLQGHVKLVHQKFRRYECDLCELKFSEKRRMIAHKRKRHPEENGSGQQIQVPVTDQP